MVARILLPLVALATLTFAALQVVKAQQKPPPGAPPVEPAKSPYTTAVAGAGLVEPETENLSIGTHVPGVVERVLVRVGDAVKPGVPLFRLVARVSKDLRTALSPTVTASTAFSRRGTSAGKPCAADRRPRAPSSRSLPRPASDDRWQRAARRSRMAEALRWGEW